MDTRKKIALGELFTKAELDKAIDIMAEDPAHFHARVEAEIVAPAIPRINARTGQGNHAGFWAYAIEYALISGVNDIVKDRKEA